MKSISIILILSLLHLYLGCYSTKLIKADEEDGKNEIRENLEDSSKDIIVKTYDSCTYMFNQNTYKMIEDTLQGTGCKIIPDSNFCKIENPESEYEYLTAEKMSLEIVIIDLRNIKEIEFDEVDTARIIQGSIVGAAAIGLFVLAIAGSSIGGRSIGIK